MPDTTAASSRARLLPAGTHGSVAVLALADGTVFRGTAIGAPGHSVGEVVFNTAMTGYQEILTDPSYAGQIVTLTYPHIGNVGVNAEDVESRRVFAAGLVIRDLPRVVSNFRSRATSRRISRPTGSSASPTSTRGDSRGSCASAARRTAASTRRRRSARPRSPTRSRARRPRRRWRGSISRASCRAPSRMRGAGGTWALGEGYRAAPASKFHVVAYDFGVKHNILRLLAERGCRITVVPGADDRRRTVRALAPDGVFLSNGPGDPEPCTYAIDAIRTLVDGGLPTFGICLGHQLLGLASGGRTLKMKFGHHGANHPVLDRDTGQVLITSQNHGFAVDPASLPSNVRVTHVSLFDGSLQGIARTDRPAFGFQGHPEASPGPHDIRHLFDRFIKLMEKNRP